MANLAIKGHETRGKEVIEILEMLGGKNNAACTGSNTSKMYVLTDSSTGYSIDYVYLNNGKFKIFTLEEFLEKFPYKVGDRVLLKGVVKIIKQAFWSDINNEVFYTLKTNIRGFSEEYCVHYYDLQPYKEETMEHFKNNEETKMSIPESMKQITEAAENLIAPEYVQDSFIMSEEQLKKQERCIIFQNDAPDKTELVLGDEFEIKVDGGKTFVVRKQPQYPKTFEDCLKILGYNIAHTIPMNHGHNGLLLMKLQRLLICRDAYWKIAGEKNKDNINYVICNVGGKIINTNIPNSAYNHILAFPTEEMRDAFYENFKELIEECKKLL